MIKVFISNKFPHPNLKSFLIKTISLVATFAILLTLTQSHILSEGSEEELDSKKQEIEQLKKDLERVRGEKQTLSSTVNYLNGKIKLTQAQINQTETQLEELKIQIDTLISEISELDVSSEQITRLLVYRISDTYKKGRINPFVSLISSDDLNQLVSHYKYLQTTQKHDKRILYQLEITKANLSNQKTVKEEKQLELDNLSANLELQKTTLATQESEKRVLLNVTKNDEKNFQTELSKKLAELEAIQSIIAGRGDETEVGSISEGSTIAQVIPSSSTCSSGAHLHFEIAKDKSHLNPANYLTSKSVTWDNAPDGEFSFGGSWRWPLNDPVRVTQGYGMTFYASTMRYYGGEPHTGIDMINKSDYTVKAVKSGTLFRGAIGCGGGTLRYVRVSHDDEISSYYLHVNY